MSKRRRLTVPEVDPGLGPMPPLETKAMFGTYPDGVWQRPARPPIAGVAGEAAATAALADLAQALTAARAEGRLVEALPLEAVDERYLVRDRLEPGDGEEMAALMASLAARGQQVPIEVVELGADAAGARRYGLISGWRRLTALRRLAAGQGGTVLAMVRTPASAAEAYRAMVEENEIRAGLSFWERARVVVQAVEKGVYRADRVALADLYAAAPAARRSKIGSFVRLVRALDGVLRFPVALSEKQGLALAKALEADADLVARLRAMLDASPPADPGAEARTIQRAIEGATAAGADVTRSESEEKRPVTPETGAVSTLPDELSPGLYWCDHGNGSVTLSGPALRGIRELLRAWLAGKLT